MKNFIQNNIKEYDKKYLKLGYGINYPEGHVIRHSRFFKNKNSILDFGCGNGTHLKFFSDINIKNIYGVDTSKIINRVKNRKFKVYRISEEENLIKKINRKFDIIFSNQTLYYLSNEKISFYFKQFYQMLNKNGLIFTTWMAPKGEFYKYSKKIKDSEFRELKFSSRLKEITYINFKTKKQIEKIMKNNNFKTLHYGHYDIKLNHNEPDSGCYHYLNLSKKN
jgi:cyclopropane fatty-acyl-phospholipid synthase-like methyltransferase